MKIFSYFSLTTTGVAFANQLVRFDDPKFLLRGIFDENDLDADQIFDTYMSGDWCSTLDSFTYPNKNDWAAFRANPVEKYCKMWRICRIETKRKEHTCNQINYRNRNSQGVNNQRLGTGARFFAGQSEKLAYAADHVANLQQRNLAGYTCNTDVNETPCLRKTCICDLSLADNVLNYMVDFYKTEIAAGRGEEHGLLIQEDSEIDENSQELEISEEELQNFNKDQASSSAEETKQALLELSIDSEIPEETEIDQAALDEKVVEIVEDHAKLVEEHSKLVEDIASFKEKVQDVVAEHAKNTMTDLRDSLAPVEDLDQSLAVENTDFEEASDTIEHTVVELIENSPALLATEEVESQQQVEQTVTEESQESQEEENQIIENEQEIPDELQEISELPEINIDIPEDMMKEIQQRHEAGEAKKEGNDVFMIDDIAMFNQDFVFSDAIKK